MSSSPAGLLTAGPTRRRMLSAAAAGLLLLPVLSRRAAAAPAAVLGRVAGVAGEAALLRGAERLPATAGTEVHEGDGVITGPEARVEIRTVDGSSIVIGPDSTVSLASFAPPAGGPGSALLDLVAGILRITLSAGATWSPFEVRSATAVASVRSTDWIVDAGRAKTGVFVVDGRVTVASRAGAGEVVLAPGEGTDVLVGAAPTTPKAWGQARVDGVLARTRLP